MGSWCEGEPRLGRPQPLKKQSAEQRQRESFVRLSLTLSVGDAFCGKPKWGGRPEACNKSRDAACRGNRLRQHD